MTSTVELPQKQRFQIFSQTIIMAAIPISILQGIFFALEGPREIFNLLVICFSLASLFFSFKSLKTHGSLLIWVIQFFFYQLILFLIYLVVTKTQFNFRLLQVCIVVLYLATAMVLLLAVVGNLSLQKAFVLSFSLAAVFFFIELTLDVLRPSKDKNQAKFAGPEWVGRKKMHKMVDSYYSPYSELKSVYPDNSRGYFEKEDMK